MRISEFPYRRHFCWMKTNRRRYSENLDHLRHFAGELLFSRHRALGILVARGTIPILPSAKASRVLDEILEARDTLNLPPDDPFGDMFRASAKLPAAAR